MPNNNSVSETTTVLPITDLQVFSKTVDHSVVDLNQTFIYTIMVGNKGPSIASGVVMTDVIPCRFCACSTTLRLCPNVKRDQSYTRQQCYIDRQFLHRTVCQQQWYGDLYAG
ncbi:MAG: hypothetical protein WDM70_07065 [Nitrosomonadales bacterium]